MPTMENFQEIEATEISEIRITDEEVWIKTRNGREACERFADYPALRDATAEQRHRYTVEPFGIYWQEVDEGLGFSGFFK